jgi:hypothetical protein
LINKKEADPKGHEICPFVVSFYNSGLSLYNCVNKKRASSFPMLQCFRPRKYELEEYDDDPIYSYLKYRGFKRPWVPL